MTVDAKEITPKMIKAGEAAFLAWDDSDDWSTGRLAESVYLAMEAAAPADEIEITPLMIDAGLAVLLESGRLAEGPLSSDSLLVEELLRASLAAKPSA